VRAHCCDMTDYAPPVLADGLSQIEMCPLSLWGSLAANQLTET